MIASVLAGSRRGRLVVEDHAGARDVHDHRKAEEERGVDACCTGDAHGFICTGLANAEAQPRTPMPHETTQHGVFAVGDVRAGSVKRVASAVGEGSVVVSQLHSYLAESRQR